MQYHPRMAKKTKPKKQDAVLSIRLYSHELQAIKKAAKLTNRSVSEWVTDKCVAAAKRSFKMPKK